MGYDKKDMIEQKIQETIQEAIKHAQEKGSLSFFEPSKVKVEHPENDSFGDYSSNVALRNSQAAGLKPQELAQVIIDHIEDEAFEKVEIAGPGFINFFLSASFLQDQVRQILKKENGFCQQSSKEEKILLEFISANPTGQLHVGNGRGAFFGDVLARIFKKAGFQAETEYYVNDAKNSKQINELGLTALGEGQSYLTPYLEKKIEQLQVKAQDSSEAGFLLAQEVQKDNQAFIEKDLKVHFDYWFSEEANLYNSKKIEETLNFLKEKGVTYEKDQAVWLKTTDYGDKQDWVIVREDGQPSYLLADIAYHKDKFDRGYDKVIDIWGADHQGHVRKMKAVSQIFDFSGVLEILITQMVNIKNQKLSKRAGHIILLADLIEEVGLDAARFFYLMKSLDTQMEFDLELAKEQSQKNPVYYVQYAYARICSIFKKAKKEGLSWELKKADFDLLTHQAEKKLIKQLLRWPEIILQTASDYQVQRLSHYTMDLASCFHNFYQKCQVVGEDKDLSQARLSLLKATQITLKDVLETLGISTPEQM